MLRIFVGTCSFLYSEAAKDRLICVRYWVRNTSAGYGNLLRKALGLKDCTHLKYREQRARSLYIVLFDVLARVKQKRYAAERRTGDLKCLAFVANQSPYEEAFTLREFITACILCSLPSSSLFTTPISNIYDSFYTSLNASTEMYARLTSLDPSISSCAS